MLPLCTYDGYVEKAKMSDTENSLYLYLYLYRVPVFVPVPVPVLVLLLRMHEQRHVPIFIDGGLHEIHGVDEVLGGLQLLLGRPVRGPDHVQAQRREWISARAQQLSLLRPPYSIH